MTTADKLKKEALAQIAVIEKRFTELVAKGGSNWYESRLTAEELSEFSSMCLTAIERIAGKQHTYSIQARETIRVAGGGVISNSNLTAPLFGIVKALKHDVENGYLVEFSEIEHANLFADFLEMGDYLLEKSYKDAAAVIIGSVLESHLRQLSQKNGLPIADTDPSGKSIPRKADRLNTELGKAKLYNLLEQKQVTAWLDLRNKAAHGNYSDYTQQQVESFSRDLKSFMTRYPA